MEIDCPKGGNKRFRNSSEAAECLDNCKDGNLCPFVKPDRIYKLKRKYSEDDERGNEPLSKPSHSSFGLAIFAIILIIIGVAFLLGIGKY
jgi:hypothetical protein